MSRPRQIELDDILAAAMRVLVRDGLSALTIEATAREAGVSKGGVLYSYRTKDDLLRGLVRYAIGQLERDIEARMADDPDPRGRYVRAYVAASCPPPGGPGSDRDRLFAALFAAVATRKELLGSVEELERRTAERVAADGVDLVEHTLTMLAVDGLTLGRFFGSVPPPEVYDAVVRRLIERTRGP